MNISNSKSRTPPFHIVIHARDMNEARDFYSDILGCHGLGHGTSIDFNFYGHHLTCHLDSTLGRMGTVASHRHSRDDQGLPTPRYGIFLEMQEWRELADRLIWRQVGFIVEPTIRFETRPEEEAIMVFLDPTGNALEFKSVSRRRYEIYIGAD